MGLLGQWREHRRFARLEPAARNLVFYAESRQDWHHFEGMLEVLRRDFGQRACYVTSDPGDPVLTRGDEWLTPFLITEGLSRTSFFQTLRCDVLVLTMMDLHCLELRRSLHPVHYVYVFHSLGSTHMVDRPDAYDHYDTLLCAGPHQQAELRRREELQGLPAKELRPHGYARLEALLELARRAPPPAGPERVVLVAPTWGEHSILPVCGEPLVEALLGAGYRVIVRPHQQTLRGGAAPFEAVRRRYAQHPRFETVTHMGESDSLLRSELLISDWSAMALEYALALERPVLFIDVPPRVRNPAYRELGLEPVEIAIRAEVGRVLDPGRLAELPKCVDALLEERPRLSERAAALRERYVFNLGESARVGARAIAELAAARRGRGAAAAA